MTNGTIVFTGSIVSVICQQVTQGEKTKTFEYAERAPGVRMIVVDLDGKICLTKEKQMCLSGQVSEDRSVAVLLQWLL